MAMLSGYKYGLWVSARWFPNQIQQRGCDQIIWRKIWIKGNSSQSISYWSKLAPELLFTPLRCLYKVSLNLLLYISPFRKLLIKSGLFFVLEPRGLPAFFIGKALPYLWYLLVFFIFLVISYLAKCYISLQKMDFVWKLHTYLCGFW